MLLSLWRRLWHGTPVLSRKKGLSGGRQLAYRPKIETLEGRAVPALWGSTLVPVVTGAGILPKTVSSVPAGITPLNVTVSQNASDTVLDLSRVFAAMPGLQHETGLHLTVLGNTNAKLVTADLSGSALTLTYTRGLCGNATITVNATDADGVCAQEKIVVTVLPLRPVAGATVAPKPSTPRTISW
jgi:hypothetical protein